MGSDLNFTLPKFDSKTVISIILLCLFTVIPLTAQGLNDSLKLEAANDSTYSSGQQPELTSHFYKVFVVTALIILFLVLILFVYKKLVGVTGNQNKSKIYVLSRQNIGPKQSVVIVAIENKKYALGVTDHNINILTELGEASEEDLATVDIKQVSQNFASIFEKIRKNK